MDFCSYNLTIDIILGRQPIQHFSPHTTRTLVGVLVNPENSNKEVIENYQRKLAELSIKLY
jgi:hypothetical protein